MKKTLFFTNAATSDALENENIALNFYQSKFTIHNAIILANIKKELFGWLALD